jgi:hypothetical protein
MRLSLSQEERAAHVFACHKRFHQSLYFRLPGIKTGRFQNLEFL